MVGESPRGARGVPLLLAALTWTRQVALTLPRRELVEAAQLVFVQSPPAQVDVLLSGPVLLPLRLQPQLVALSLAS